MAWRISLVLLSVAATEAYAENVNGAKPLTVKQLPNKQVPKRIHSSELIREKFSVGVGSHFSHGEYNTNAATNIVSSPLRLGYSRSNWSVSAQIPYLYITGPASVISINNGTESIETRAEGKRQRWGNGDLSLSGQYQLPKYFSASSRLHLGSTIKVPVASDKADLGSGEFDYSLFGGAYVRKGRWVNNGRVGYQLMGDSTKTNYNNRWFASLGVYHLFNRAYSAGFSAYFKQAATKNSEPVRTASTFITWRLPKGLRCNFSIGAGLSESSADVFGGVQITKTFVRKRRIASSK